MANQIANQAISAQEDYMSAWIPSKQHINAMVWMRFDTFPPTGEWVAVGTPEERNEFGQMLTDEVVRSVSYQYPSDKLEELPGARPAWWLEPYEYVEPIKKPSREAQAAILGCYNYQACEHEGYDSSDALKFVDAFKGKLPEDYEVVHGTDPDVNDGKGSDVPWGWDHD